MTSSDQEALYLPGDLAIVTPDVHTKPYWDACARQELRIQRCCDCRGWQHPPITGCQSCGSFNREFVLVSGKGVVYSFTIPCHPVIPSVRECVPYNVVVVALNEAPGVRLISNLIDMDSDEIRIGMPVELAWQRVDEDVCLARFRSASV